jgi:hypothetical protein
MGKAKSSNKSSYTSKGERKNVNQKTLNAVRNDTLPAVKLLNIQKAWKAGKNPWITLPNPNKNETNKRFIRIRMNDLNGSYKEFEKKMFVMT